ncbi:D-alanyl-D-alanine carboxypeptidase/D-alanyl-D-alanine endopeptidase [Tateyamaria omphalii]|uniref:D-alanyl-D-alanine carboxypeptidase/D-alanyl-D-alanine-endopeptidase n=1 Tax=Tateyamaria omphalii TaxID=299262 RepID=A0A1P8N003_9RHOB|nr:D-alanyl-D-alanine carboxypeptidase/D-alanyl-D-alanine-endopeptidase [Tateyamaria omphalii]APX13568.1 D-alanyl-D-alanine carboxypeptidase/D-alanyl-D-alanine-endopeptidase [Tateyamaria omphalii]
MLRRFSRRCFLAALAGTTATTALAAPPTASLRPSARGGDHFKKAIADPQAIITDARLGGRVCYAVADARTGTKLEGENAKIGTPPASVAKAITALYALSVLGATHRFTTRVVATGGVSGGVVQGDLVLVGGGDPTLDTNALAALAAALKAKGIREVRGDFKVADGMFPQVPTIDTGQPDHVGYSPALSGIALNFNRVHFEWRRQGGQYAVSMDARSDRYRPDVAMARMAVSERRAPVYTYADGGRTDNWTVARGALGNGGARWLPVRKPALYAGDVFQTLARSQGMVLKNPQVVSRTPQGTTLASHQSGDLRTILRDMLRFSTNITAEMVGMAATVKRSGRPASLRASATEMNRWARAALGTSSMRLVDHSGLGDASKMTADDMVLALVRARQNNVLRPILKPIPMLDAQRRAIRNHPVEVHAKTGTLNFVSGLAGYMTARDGTEMAFAIFAADEATRAGITRANRERPQGARSWNRRAKVMQQKLIERWGAVYGS